MKQKRLHLLPWQAFVAALTIESLAVAAVVGWLVMHPHEAAPKFEPITIEALNPTPAPTPAQAEPEVVKPLPTPPVLQKIVRQEKPVERPVVQNVTAPLVESPPQVSTPTAFTAPAVIPPAAPVHTGPSPEYLAKVKAAVQAMAKTPPAAQELNFQGRAQVEFKLRDGLPSQAHIVTGSGMSMIDRAALLAVQDAVYPPPPPASQGKEELYLIWVKFGF